MFILLSVLLSDFIQCLQSWFNKHIKFYEFVSINFYNTAIAVLNEARRLARSLSKGIVEDLIPTEGEMYFHEAQPEFQSASLNWFVSDFIGWGIYRWPNGNAHHVALIWSQRAKTDHKARFTSKQKQI